MDLTPQDNPQLNLFESQINKHDELMKTIDRINHKLGTKKIKLASQDLARTWKMKQTNLSPRYTTHWNEILEVE